jgi:hypothetical protein
MFIAQEPNIIGKLRRSEILSVDSYFAPTELKSIQGAGFYEHPAPTELHAVATVACRSFFATLGNCDRSNTLPEHYP